MTNKEANLCAACLECGKPGSTMYVTRDGRIWRACDLCARTSCADLLNGATLVNAHLFASASREQVVRS